MICDFMQACTLEALGLAFGVSQYNEIQETVAAQQQQYDEDYTGTPSSINPDTFDTNFDGTGDEDDNQVLCSAAEAFVKMFAAQKAQQLKLTLGATALMLSLVTLLVPGLGWILASGIYIAIGAATLITGVTYGVAIAALEDEAALNAVSCCLKSSLEGMAVTEANWNAAITACGFATGSHSEIVREFVQIALAYNYLTFLDILGTAKHAQDLEEPVSCVCGGPEVIGLYWPDLDETVEYTLGVEYVLNSVAATGPDNRIFMTVEGCFSVEVVGVTGYNPSPFLQSSNYWYGTAPCPSGSLTTHNAAGSGTETPEDIDTSAGVSQYVVSNADLGAWSMTVIFSVP